MAVIHRLADYNSVICDITVDKLALAGQNAGSNNTTGTRKILSQSSKYSLQHIKALFVTPKMAWSTSLLIAIWGKSIVSGYQTFIDPSLKVSLVWDRRCTTVSSHICQPTVSHFLCTTLNIFCHSLTSRGAHFGDGSLYITYRNVCTFAVHFITFSNHICTDPSAASHPQHSWHSWNSFGQLACRATIHRKERHTGSRGRRVVSVSLK